MVTLADGCITAMYTARNPMEPNPAQEAVDAGSPAREIDRLSYNSKLLLSCSEETDPGSYL